MKSQSMVAYWRKVKGVYYSREKNIEDYTRGREDEDDPRVLAKKKKKAKETASVPSNHPLSYNSEYSIGFCGGVECNSDFFAHSNFE